MRAVRVVAVLLALVGVAAADKAKDSLACDRADLKACERACKAGDGIACTERGLAAASRSKDPAAGKSSFEAACTAGETYGCKLLAQLGEHASPQDLTTAATMYRRACTLGSDTACARIGANREDKVASASYPPRLVEAIRAACTAKHWPSCTELGGLYSTGRGVTKDDTTANTAFDTACAAGELWSCSNLGIQLGSAKTSVIASEELLTRACNGGISHACYFLARFLTEGKAYAADLPRAIKLFEEACDNYYALACTSLGIAYINALGVTKDEARGEKLLVKACAGFSAFGCAELARMHDGQRGTPDYKIAFDANTVACERGNGGGCLGLGILHHKGLGIPVDLAKARALYQRGCDLKSGAACNNLGVLLHDGGGGAKDETRAADLYRQGCDLENGAACKNLADATSDKAKAQGLRDKGCKLGEQQACTDAAAARK